MQTASPALQRRLRTNSFFVNAPLNLGRISYFSIVDFIQIANLAQVNRMLPQKAVSYKRELSQLGDAVVTPLQQTGKPVDLLSIGLF